jgi:hypothetical protein
MSSAATPVENLLHAVKQLSPDELSEFTAGLSEWRESAADEFPSEGMLIRQTKQCLPPSDLARLRELSLQSERGDLNPSCLKEYRELAARSERINASRVFALAELARRRNQPIDQVKKELGWRARRSSHQGCWKYT